MKNIPSIAPYPQHTASPLIIEPSKIPVLTRGLYWIVTTLIWIIWIYLWAPLFSYAIWSLGLSKVANVSAELGLKLGFLNLTILYWIIAGCFSVTIVWVAFKKRTFPSGIFRKPVQTVSRSDFKNPDKLDFQSAGHLSHAFRTRIFFNKLGKPVKVLLSKNMTGLLNKTKLSDPDSRKGADRDEPEERAKEDL